MLRLAALAPLVLAVTTVQDTPAIVIHKSIGDVRLGMARSDVQATYGTGRTERFRH